MAFIYILHFDTPNAHAEHYCGSTESLKQRLEAHADQHGARLIEAIQEKGHSWRLGALATCTKTTMRRIERSLKDNHNTPRYCQICNDMPMRIPGTQPLDTGLIRFPTDSGSLSSKAPDFQDVAVRLTTQLEPATTMDFIKDLMRKDKDALGFIPAGGKEGLQTLLDTARLAIISNNNDDIGYAAFTLSPDKTRLNIHQACIRDDARCRHHGTALVDFIRHLRPSAAIWAKVRTDLPANLFWTALGFQIQRSVTHHTSGSLIHHYLRPPERKPQCPQPNPTRFSTPEPTDSAATESDSFSPTFPPPS